MFIIIGRKNINPFLGGFSIGNSRQPDPAAATRQPANCEAETNVNQAAAMEEKQQAAWWWERVVLVVQDGPLPMES